jgi:hypothetical protein
VPLINQQPEETEGLKFLASYKKETPINFSEEIYRA